MIPDICRSELITSSIVDPSSPAVTTSDSVDPARPAVTNPVSRTDRPTESAVKDTTVPDRGDTYTKARETPSPSGEATVTKPIGEATGTKPIGKATLTKPIGEATLTKPIGEATVTKPIGEATITKPIGEDTGTKPIGDATVTKPIGEATLTKPIAKTGSLETTHTERKVDPATTKLVPDKVTVTKPTESKSLLTSSVRENKTVTKPTTTKKDESPKRTTSPQDETGTTHATKEKDASGEDGTVTKPTSEKTDDSPKVTTYREEGTVSESDNLRTQQPLITTISRQEETVTKPTSVKKESLKTTRSRQYVTATPAGVEAVTPTPTIRERRTGFISRTQVDTTPSATITKVSLTSYGVF